MADDALMVNQGCVSSLFYALMYDKILLKTDSREGEERDLKWKR
jgi:hypothetical protein